MGGVTDEGPSKRIMAWQNWRREPGNINKVEDGCEVRPCPEPPAHLDPPDLECWMSHWSVMSARDPSSLDPGGYGALSEWTDVVPLLAGDGVAADFPVLDGGEVEALDELLLVQGAGQVLARAVR